jgi:hypothetical protein
LIQITTRVKEAQVEQALKLWTAKAGGTALKVKVIGRRGFVDRLILLPGGRVIFVELKRPVGGRLSPQQKQFHDELRNLNMTVVLVKNPSDIARLMPTL